MGTDYHKIKLQPGERVAILGAKRAGKSQLLSALMSDAVDVHDDAIVGKDPAAATRWLQDQIQHNEKTGRTVVAVLPSISWAKRFATRVIGLREGKTVFDNKPESLDDEVFRNIYLVATEESAEPVAKAKAVSASASRTASKKSEQKNAQREFLFLLLGTLLGAGLTLLSLKAL